MLRIFVGLLALAGACFAQGGPPTVTMSQDAPPSGTCVDAVQVGNIIIRSNNTAVLPVGVYRCTQILDPSVYGAGAFSWQPIGHFSGATLPAKCAVGEIAFRTGATAGQNIYGCTAKDVWSLQAGGGGGGGAAGTTGDVQVNAGSGSFGAATIPDCPDTAGQHLNYNHSTHTWFCGTSSSGGGGGGALSWAALTSGQWASLTGGQWAALTN